VKVDGRTDVMNDFMALMADFAFWFTSSRLAGRVL